jgi:hypothetical protein
MSEPTISGVIFNTLESRSDYNGWGYIRGRYSILKQRGMKAVARADADLLHFAAINGWSNEDLFVFCNSKDGRYYSDAHEDGRTRRAIESLQYYNDNWMLVARKDRGISYEESVAA